MATYTPNYNLNKPTFAELADVRTFNGNMDIIDNVMNASQNSIAEPYDSTETYNEGDMVMYELYLYKCLEETTGTWDATKWERAYSASSGAGITYPQDATKYLNGMGQWTVPAGGGGSGSVNVYGAFIDTNKVITTLTGSGSGTDFQQYTATEDCAVVGTPKGDSVAVQIDGVTVAYTSDTDEAIGVCTLVKKGQVISYRITSDSTLTIYGLTFGTNNIFAPQIYSTEEREIGVWVDNKPIYQKTFVLSSAIIANANEWNIISDISITDVENVVSTEVYLGDDKSNNDFGFGKYENGNFKYFTASQIYIKSFTIRYTKTTDTAGSGSYNTLGVPTVHYSTDEQVVGTWIDGKPLYQKTIVLPSEITVSNTDWTSSGITASSLDIETYIRCSAQNSTGTCWDAVSVSTINDEISLTAWRNGDTVAVKIFTIQYTKVTV